MNGHEDNRNEKGQIDQPESYPKPRLQVIRTLAFKSALDGILGGPKKGNGRGKHSSSYAELSADFNKSSSSRQVSRNDESEQPPTLGNEPSVRKIKYENRSLPYRELQTSGTKTNCQVRNQSKQNFRSDSTESRPQYSHKFSGEPHHQNFKKGPYQRDSFSPNFLGSRGSQENLDLNGNRDVNYSTNKHGNEHRGKTYMQRFIYEDRDFKHFKSGRKHPLSRSHDSLVDCNSTNGPDEQDSWTHNQNSKQAVNSFGGGDSVSTYKRNYQGPNRSESKSKGYGLINKRDQSSFGYKSHGEENQFRSAKHSAEVENKVSFSTPYHSDKKSHPKATNHDRKYLKNDTRDTDPHHNSYLKRGAFNKNPPLKSISLDTDKRSSHATFDTNHHLRSGTWDSDDCESSTSYEPRVNENKQPENLKITKNVGSDENKESLKSPPITLRFHDKQLNCSVKTFFSPYTDCKGLVPIPAPHPFTDRTALPKDDALSESSKNQHSSGSNYIASSEGGTSSCGSDESDCVLEPKQIEAVTDYLKKKENERSVPVEIVKGIVSDVNRVLRYWAKGNEVVLYGSYLSGLAISTSNVNLALKSNQRSQIGFLRSFQKELSKDLVGYEVVAFEEEVAVRDLKICFYESKSGVTCEIMYAGSTVSDHIRTSHLLKSICDYDPRVKTLIIASRIWAEVCVIHETENGQLHPVGFAFLVVHFLQQIKPPVLPIIDVLSKDMGLKPLPERNCLEIGQLWYGFLKYYSETFSWTKNVVTVLSKDAISKSTYKYDNWIAIQDPWSMKNVAGSVATIDNAQYIFSCFKAYYEHISTSNNSGSESDDSGDKNTVKEWKYSFDSSCVNCPLPLFCEACDALENGLCDACALNQQTFTPTLEKLPEVDHISIKFIDRALLDVYNDIILPDTSIKGRKAFVQDLEAYIRKIFWDAELTLFGSSVNKFGIKHSDLDICMTFSNKDKKDIQEVKVLKRITSHLRKNAKYQGVFGLYSAQVPIVKFHCPSQKWNCDLCLYNVLPVHNSRLLSKYAMIDERCRILGCALKHLAMKGWIADSSSKTLSSYSYILMVIHYLQQTQPPVLPVLPLEDQKVFIEKKEIPRGITTGKNYWFHEDADALKKRYNMHPRNEASTAELWIGFLNYYLTFDNKYAVTITQKEPLLVSELQKRARLINIEDPFIHKRNLGCVLSEAKAERTYKIFVRARSLFGHTLPIEKIENPRSHYFSTNNLTGQYTKEMECTSCGAFDHEKEKCLKANPFLNFNLKRRSRITRFPYKRKK